MTERHAGQVAIVTGAGSGIGRGIARRLAAEGAAVACLDVRPGSAQETAGLIAAAYSGRSLAVVADVRNRAEVEAALASTLSAFGKIDYLVNNAGIVTMTGFEELTDDEWDMVLDVNLKGYFIVGQVVSRAIQQAGGGAIVNISTIESEVVVSSTGHCQVHYNASKGGVKMLTKAMAVELASKHIRVNAVAPGPINTAFTGGDITSPAAWEFMKHRLLVPRVGEPEDIAAAVSFLLSDDAAYITGAQLPVDGGWLTR
jgi:NAD(P)-dependent dehydrogenase (short-subunit alcohol dehydrogenase family)